MEDAIKPKLTKEDIKAIRYQYRTGYILSAMLFLIGLFMVFVFKAYPLTDINKLNINELILFGFAMALFSLLVSYVINRKYISDIRNGVKKQEIRLIQKKQSKQDYEAGSGTLYIDQEMKGRIRYDIIVNNIPYRVDRSFFLNCNEGDEVLFNFAPRSNFLINVELKKSKINSSGQTIAIQSCIK